MNKKWVAALLLSIAWVSAAGADNWTEQMSPRLKEAFRPMLRDDWKPQREVELTPSERRQLLQSYEVLKKSGFFQPPEPKAQPERKAEVPLAP